MRKKCAKHEDYHSLAESRGLVSGPPRRRTPLPKSADPTVPTLCPYSHPQSPPNPESSNESTGSWHRGLSCCQVADAENANVEEHCARKRSQRTRRMALCEARWVATVGDGLVSSRLFSPVHGPSQLGSSGYPAESFRKSGRAVLTLSCVLLAFLYLVWKGLGLRKCCMTLLANFCSGFLSINSGLSELHANRSSRCQPTMETIAADYVRSVATGDSDTTSSINVGSESRPTGNFCGDVQNQNTAERNMQSSRPNGTRANEHVNTTETQPNTTNSSVKIMYWNLRVLLMVAPLRYNVFLLKRTCSREKSTPPMFLQVTP
ncbi:hypothetical protein B0H14DRAFT_3568723 [Mycena olivaceomarginata]|nr:hypothetical protein B0H14DRAFT_3568723 [Mycena olivaceomarginata]